MDQTFTLVIPAVALFIYIILSSIEFGGSVFSVFPSLLTDENSIKNYMNPLWETTTIFLAFALISLFSFFPGATSTWTLGIFSVLFAFLICMGVRVISILLTQYGAVKSLAVRMLYFVSCFASALVGMFICMYFLTGDWHLTGWVLLWTAVLTFSTIVVLAASFFRAYSKNEKMTQLVRGSGTLFFLSATLFFIATLNHNTYLYRADGGHIMSVTPIALMVSIVCAVIAEGIGAYRLSFVAFCIGVGSLFWGFFNAHLPYIVYPSTTIADSLTNAASLNVLEASFCIGIIFVVPAIILLYKLFMFNPKKASH